MYDFYVNGEFIVVVVEDKDVNVVMVSVESVG